MSFKKVLFLLFSLSLAFLHAAEFDIGAIKITPARNSHKFAAEELQKHLSLAGAPQKSAKTALEIIIGRPGEKVTLKPAESRYLLKGNKLYIWGDDTNRRNGTLSAVYALLENKLNAKWLFPGDEGIAVTPVKKISFKDNESFSWTPPLKWGYVRGYGALAAFQSYVDAPVELYKTLEEEKAFAEDVKIFLLRQRQGRVARPGYGHAFIKWADRYYKSHPEYFGMDEKGKRTLPRDKTRAKLCLSNPAVIEQIVAEWKQSGAPPTVNICPNDGTPGFCRCPDCMKLDARKPGEDFYAHLTDRYLNFWNRFLKRAREEKSDIMAVTYVYSYYRHPPRRERVLYPDNLLCGLVPTLAEDSKALFDAWKKAGMKHSFLRPNDLCYRSQILRFMEKRIYDKFQSTRKAFKLHGADYDAGAWVPALDLESYTAVRMIAFPEESFEKIQADFCSGFGKAAGVVSEFYNTMRPFGEKMYQNWIRGGKNARYLDDSMVRSSSDKAYMEALGKGINKLVCFPRAGLSDLEQKRLNRLIRNAEHSLLISIFMQEGQLKMSGKANRFESAAVDLWHFRLKPGKVLPICWGRAFGAEEKRFWEMSSIYHKYVLKDELNVDDPAAGWINSFDASSPQGWRMRNGFDKFSSKEAASGKYSVQSKKSNREDYVISKHGVPVTPGAQYTVSFETKAPAGSLCRLRVRIEGKDLCQIRVISKENSWKKSSATFKIPSDVKSVMIYCCAKAPKGAFFDNIRLKRL